MVFLWYLLRTYSWILQAVLCAAAILVACASYVTGSQALSIGWIPIPADRQAITLLGLGLLGLLCVLLAVAGRLRILLFLFSIHTLYMLVKGFFLSPGYSFPGPDEFRYAVILTIGAFFALIGAWPIGGRRRSAVNSRVR